MSGPMIPFSLTAQSHNQVIETDRVIGFVPRSAAGREDGKPADGQGSFLETMQAATGSKTPSFLPSADTPLATKKNHQIATDASPENIEGAPESALGQLAQGDSDHATSYTDVVMQAADSAPQQLTKPLGTRESLMEATAIPEPLPRAGDTSQDGSVSFLNKSRADTAWSPPLSFVNGEKPSPGGVDDAGSEINGSARTGASDLVGKEFGYSFVNAGSMLGMKAEKAEPAQVGGHVKAVGQSSQSGTMAEAVARSDVAKDALEGVERGLTQTPTQSTAVSESLIAASDPAPKAQTQLGGAQDLPSIAPVIGKIAETDAPSMKRSAAEDAGWGHLPDMQGMTERAPSMEGPDEVLAEAFTPNWLGESGPEGIPEDLTSERKAQNEGFAWQVRGPSQGALALEVTAGTATPFDGKGGLAANARNSGPLVQDLAPPIADSWQLSADQKPSFGQMRAMETGVIASVQPATLELKAQPELRLQVRHWPNDSEDLLQKTTPLGPDEKVLAATVTDKIETAARTASDLAGGKPMPFAGDPGTPQPLETKVAQQVSNPSFAVLGQVPQNSGLQLASLPQPETTTSPTAKFEQETAAQGRPEGTSAKIPEIPTAPTIQSQGLAAPQGAPDVPPSEMVLLAEAEREGRFDRIDRALERAGPIQTTPGANAVTISIGASIQANLPTTVGGTTEIVLDPEELGRVRMTLTGSEHSGLVLLQIERPETLELMRRNIEQLKTELAEAGWENVDFSFGQESAPDQQAQSEAESAPWVALEQEISAASEEPSSKDQHIATRGSGLSGLDLRF